MKKFVTYLLVFALPFVVLVAFFEVYLRHIDTTYTEKEKGIVRDYSKIELLILGNSRATFGIDPHQFDLYGYNLANVAQPIYYDKRIALKHLNQLTQLKYVFLTVDDNSLVGSRMGYREMWSYYGNGIEYKDKLSFIAKYCYLEGYTPGIAVQLLKNKLSGKFKVIKALDADVDYGQQPITQGFFSYTGTREEGMTLQHCLDRANKGKDEGVSPEKQAIVADLETFIQTLQAKKITPILVTLPCYQPYVQLLNKKGLERANSDFNQLAKKYKLDYWNYLTLPMERTDFHDCDHLNNSGAVKFSKLLNQRLKEKIVADSK